jgi:hypothetical protein
MSKYEVTTTEQEQIGFGFESARTGESVQDMIQRRVSEIGVGFWHDQKRAKAQELISKIQDDPDAYIDAITPIYEAKVAAEEAALLEKEDAEIKP